MTSAQEKGSNEDTCFKSRHGTSVTEKAGKEITFSHYTCDGNTILCLDPELFKNVPAEKLLSELDTITPLEELMREYFPDILYNDRGSKIQVTLESVPGYPLQKGIFVKEKGSKIKWTPGQVSEDFDDWKTPETTK